MLEPESARRPLEPANAYSHSRSRTTSSNIFPTHQPSVHSSHGQLVNQHSRRSPSINTFSTASTMAPPAAYRTSSNTDLQRSVSNRSGSTISQPTSYVALLRRQKATVWSDRAQYEDPRLAAQQRAAKARATQEIVGGRGFGGAGGRTSTGISATGKGASKIRSHGKNSNLGYLPGENHVGVGGVPLRLSATEVEAGSSDEEEQSASRAHHRRTGSSGRSSTNSGRRGLAYRTSAGASAAAAAAAKKGSQGNTPDGSRSMASGRQEDTASATAKSTASGSSAERADNVGELSTAPRLAPNSQKQSTLTREKSTTSAEELKRRGSVDERTTTFTTGRLFIANPD